MPDGNDNSKTPFFNRIAINLADDYKKMRFLNWARKFFSISLKILIVTIFLYLLYMLKFLL